ncbi:peptidase M61 domain protein [Metallosphaera sedula]|uniref:Peptidase M61 domain protein n=3 Tax=Metallosphaera TaxID=41980 RepID=A4YEQ1_METS5|nr:MULTISPECIES: M61 family metallopeptidase [Metallosphaera]ABP94903.1 peptidase M61 domain protein [Metallosphaera sedula DSM 5348]AIM26890.1 peptidase M61 domain protein [Metallosphaera sedula]AKV73828.1 peptidase M61 [Metallosphaera sedula]AKV76069.1 peptidase M61 [Metallosphaera sedula]AKV78320.1 peptidase M61 [Metallosphaera sedula]
MLFTVKPRPRYLEIEAHGREGIVIFPTYLPGSYVVRELERNIVEIDGVRISKNRFYVKENFRYLVYASSKDQREAISSTDYLFINPPAVFPFQDWNERYCVKLDLRWPVSTTLRREGEYLCADDYETFVDSPIQASPNLKTLVIDDHHEITTVDDLDLTGVAMAIKEIDKEMGTPDRYTFFFRRSDRNYGGIEHYNSSAIVVNWERSDLVMLMAHEYFHSWNVKRYRPKDLELDLEKETHSDLLWFAEGVTDYVAWLASTRSGAVKSEDTGKYMANAISKFTFPGAKRMSLAESSRTTWIKYYRQDENFLNSSVSYYDGGLLLGLILDARLRRSGENIFSIFKNIPFRYTFSDIDNYLKSRGIDDLEEMAYSPSSILLEKLKEVAELQFLDGGNPYLGIMMDGNKVTYVEDGSPADMAGLMPQDIILATDNVVRPVEVKAQVELLVNREGRVKRVLVTAGRNPGHRVKFTIKGDIAKQLLGMDSLDGTSSISLI